MVFFVFFYVAEHQRKKEKKSNISKVNKHQTKAEKQNVHFHLRELEFSVSLSLNTASIQQLNKTPAARNERLQILAGKL